MHPPFLVGHRASCGNRTFLPISSSPMIEVEKVSKSYGQVKAVQGLSFSIPVGQCVGLLGTNGAGKTTTIRMITGFIPPTLGGIRVGGHDTVEGGVDARKFIGYLPEATPLYPEMSVRDIVRFRARLYGLSGSAARERVSTVIASCRLTDVDRRRVGELSKGYKQRVGLALALVHDPAVLILDEPTSGLDPTQVLDTRSMIKDLAKNRTVIVSSHILPEIERTCDRVLIMAGGRLRADGTPQGLIESAGPTMYVIEARCSEMQGRAALAGVPNVASIQATGVDGELSIVRFHVTPQAGGRDLREALAEAFSSKGIGVRELTRMGASLEQVFVRIIESESPGKAAA